MTSSLYCYKVRAALLRDSRLYNAPHIGMHASSSASQQSGAYQRAGKFEGGRRGATQFWLGRARFAHNAARSSSHVMSLGAEKPLLSFECGDLFTAVEAKLRRVPPLTPPPFSPPPRLIFLSLALVESRGILMVSALPKLPWSAATVPSEPSRS